METSKTFTMTKEQVEERLWEICEEMAAEYNEEIAERDEDDEDDDLEVEANGYHINKELRLAEFEFTVMNDKSWSSVRFEDILTDYDLDIERYLDYFNAE